MKPSGSVLIVVLGLLAILALIGITFITMSNLDRRTATNFALQSQFMLAADGAVDYVCHHLVQDAWAYDAQTHTYKDQLLNDQNQGNGLLRNEPFDYPSDEYDPWLSTSPEDESLPASAHFSYGHLTGDVYPDLRRTGPFGLRDWGDDTDTRLRPNNLGFPTAEGGRVKVKTYTPSGQGHGVWNPELSFPFETGLVRVSVTVIDHASMMNLNAHGNPNPTADRYGYYISDADPSSLPGLSPGGLTTALSTGFGSADPLGASNTEPGNPAQMAVVIENPRDYGDHPFTLDEEVELRRLTGTFFRSRLENENFFPGLNTDPDNGAAPQKARNRLSVTTVGWTSQVRTSFNPKFTSDGEGYWWRKVDLNRDKPDDIKDAVLNANIFQDSNAAKQFAANICGFRNGENKNGVKKYAGTVGASRQPILSKVRASITETKQDDEGNATEDIWTIEVQVISPWDGDCIDDTDGLSTNGITLNAQDADFDFNPSFPNSMAGPGDPFHTSCTVSVDPGQHFTKKVKSITLECKGKVIDEIDGNDLGDIEDGQGKHRPIYYKDEERYPGDSHPVRVVYIGDWTKTGFDGAMQEWKTGDFEDTSKIPIRFPRSVLKDGDDDEGPEGGLPPYWKRGISEGYGFRAFARLGDLNQVLCPRPEDYAHLKEGEDGFWPWVPRVAKASPAVEKDLKSNERRQRLLRRRPLERPVGQRRRRRHRRRLRPRHAGRRARGSRPHTPSRRREARNAGPDDPGGGAARSRPRSRP